MKTLSIVNVVESQTLENAATVIFRLDNKICTIDVTEIPSVGQVMSKYYGTDIRVHPVARDERSRFVSIKGYEEQLIQAGLNSGWIVKTEVESVVTQEIIDLPQNDTTPINNIVEMDFGKVDKPEPISRVKGGVKLQAPEPVVKMDNIVQLDPNHSLYIEHNPDIRIDDLDNSVQGIVKQASRIFYDYFTKEMYLKTINREQLNKQFAIIWDKNVQLHFHKETMKYYIFDCIKYYFNEALGNRVFLLRDVFNQVIKKALCQSVALAQVA